MQRKYLFLANDLRNREYYLLNREFTPLYILIYPLILMRFTLTAPYLHQPLAILTGPTNSNSASDVEQKFSLSGEQSTGEFRTVCVDQHLCVLCGQLKTVCPLRLAIEPSAAFLTMHFSLAGDVAVQVGSTVPVDFGTNRHNLINAGSASLWLDISDSQSCQFVQIFVSADLFINLSVQNGIGLNQIAERVRANHLMVLGPENRTISPAMHTVLSQLTNGPLPNTLRQLFLKAKILELLALQLDQFTRNEMAAEVPAEPPEYDQLIAVRQLLETQFDNPPTLAELSRQVGLNEFTLKKRFKEVFGETIYGWVLNYRLQYAYQLLQSQQLPVGEVAYRVGYQHPAHFSTAFKKKFGVTPGSI